VAETEMAGTQTDRQSERPEGGSVRSGSPGRCCPSSARMDPVSSDIVEFTPTPIRQQSASANPQPLAGCTTAAGDASWGTTCSTEPTTYNYHLGRQAITTHSTYTI